MPWHLTKQEKLALTILLIIGCLSLVGLIVF